MIKADNKKWARLIFNPYEDLLLKKNFSRFFLTDEIPYINPDKGLIITPNHISWWDGFFIDYVSRKFISRKFYILMLEEQLKKYPFFRRTGAFSIIPGSVKSIRETFNYAAEIVKDPGNLLVFYPQGEIESFEKQPDVKPGLRLLLNNNIDILPVAFKIEYHNQKKPAVYFRPGNVISSNEALKDFHIFIKEFTDNIDQLKNDILNKNIKRDLFAGKKSA